MPAAKPFQPTDAQIVELRTLFHSTQDRRLRDRAQALLMSARGTMRKDVAAALDVHPETISVWIARFEARGVEGLKPDYCGGQQPLIPEALAAEIVEWVKQGPQACGIDRANWTFAELADHLFAMRGIRVSETTMRDFCHRRLDSDPGPPGTNLAKAVNYLLGQWAKLTVFLDHGEVPLSNNAAERALRGGVIGRKNFSGTRSRRGEIVAATLYSLISSAHQVGVDPAKYLVAVVKRDLEQPGAVLLPREYRDSLAASTGAA